MFHSPFLPFLVLSASLTLPALSAQARSIASSSPQSATSPAASPAASPKHGDLEAGRSIVLFDLSRAHEGALRHEELATRLARDVRALGGRVEARLALVPGAVLAIEDRHRSTIEALPYVESVQADRWHEPQLRTATDDAHHAADRLQRLGLRGKGSTIAFIDTGFANSYAGSPPSANPQPGLPSSKRLPANTRIAMRISVPAGRLDAISLWSASTKLTSVLSLAITAHRDTGGRPDPTPFARGTLRSSGRPSFGTAALSPRITLRQDTTIWFQFVTPRNTHDFASLVDDGVSTPCIVGNQASTLPLAWKLTIDGRQTRPHAALGTASSAQSSRIRVHQQLGRMRGTLVEQHGTGLATIAAGQRWTTRAADEGHASLAQIAMYACADTRSGAALTSTLVRAIEKVACEVTPFDLQVVLFGYAGRTNAADVLQRSLDALARNNDVLVVLPAGNRTDLSASHLGLNAMTVGASDANKLVASFSARGRVAGMAFPDLVAHGVSLVGPTAFSETRDSVSSGTSIAAAQVAGAAAQLRSAVPTMSALETRAVLTAATEASPGTSSTVSTTGPGAGYLRNDRSYEIARRRSRYGSDRITRTRNTWRRRIAVRRGQRVQFATCWQRLDSATRWANLDVTLRDGRGTPIARSTQTTSTVEFVRASASRDDIWTVEVSALLFDAPVIKFAFASDSDFLPGDGTARYSENGTGCKGSGTGGGCPAMKQDPKNLDFCPAMPQKTTHAILVQCPCSVTMNGFSLYAKASAANTPVECFLWQSTGTLEPAFTPSASGTMLVQTTPGYYTVNFTTPVALTDVEAANFFIGFRTPGGALLWLDHGTEKMGHHFEMPDWWGGWIGGGGFQGAITQYAWDWRTNCAPGAGCPGGPPPIVIGEGVPLLGSRSFAVSLNQGLPNSVAILMTGIETRCIGLRAIGAQACSLCCNTIVNVGIPIDARGNARVPLGVPQDPGLVGAVFANQWLILDQKANRLGLTLSGHGRGVIGTR